MGLRALDAGGRPLAAGGGEPAETGATGSDLERGILAEYELPSPSLSKLWDAIYLEDSMKDEVLAQAVLSFTLRAKVDSARIPMHGFILLTGRPGTGKTSLGKAVASRAAESFPKTRFRFIQLEPHALASAGLGRSQQAVHKLLVTTISERAGMGPLVVLLDEIETVGVDRKQLSMAANPFDVHRATDALLAGMDRLAEQHKRLLFIGTSNFPAALDEALLSRADRVFVLPLPTPGLVRLILEDALAELARAYPDSAHLRKDRKLTDVVAACEGLDGRQIRKIVAAACGSDKATAFDPGLVSVEQLLRAAKAFERASGAASS